MDIKKSKDVTLRLSENCHGGKGTLLCQNLLIGMESRDFRLMHHDLIRAGVTIGKHGHTVNEEIYYLLSGKGILTFDDRIYEMKAGDISLCPRGHSHGFEAVEDSAMIVVASTHDPK